ncbi:polysaccharide deacetylase [Paenibacillus turpanensis]|uniref:polysaccharide deacetylase n=1 Tax=Paenibacillus turpanensis TaxID=2689078 RepID=UPI00140AA3AC|nr:polysaccharide deacetylase [Paenibacillus turpanensis]
MPARIAALVLSFLLIAAVWTPQVWADDTLTKQQSDLYQQLVSGKRISNETSYEIPDSPTVYLTFDDGPSQHTEQVLDILQENEIQATFFVLGEQALLRPDTVRRMVREGHVLGNHSFNHKYDELYESFGNYWKQFMKTEEAIRQLTGSGTSLARAPGGTYNHYDNFYFYYMELAGIQVHDWNVDSGDSRRRGVPASEIIANVKKAPLQHEMNVLMHDGAGHEETVKALPEIISYFQEKGYRFAPLSEKVKPMQFRLSPFPKYKRTHSENQFNTNIQLVRDFRAHYAKEQQAIPIPTVTEKVYATVAIAEAVTSALPKELRLQTGTHSLKWTDSDFKLKNDRFYVPLRQMAESLGADITWIEVERTAILRYGFTLIRYQMDTHVVTVSGAQGEREYRLADTALQKGRIWVPLRTTLEWLGSGVQSYQVGPQSSEVVVRPYGQAVIFLPKA